MRPVSSAWLVTWASCVVAALANSESDEQQFIESGWPVGVSWACFFFVSLYTTHNICKHLLNYSRPDLQVHVLRILLVGPLYALSCALCLSMEESLCFFVEAVRDIWEAVVIYSFLTLIIEYMGGEHLCLHTLSQQEGSVSHPFPFDKCLRPVPMASMIRLPKIGALQFVVVKPVVAVLSIGAYAADEYDSWAWYVCLVVVYNISYTLALYGLGMVYKVAHKHTALKSKSPLMKFLSVKMIVFLTFWQALFFPALPMKGSRKRWEDLILSVEMAFFSLIMNQAFSWREFDWNCRDPRMSTTRESEAQSRKTSDQDVKAAPDSQQPAANGHTVTHKDEVPDLINMGETSSPGATPMGAQTVDTPPGRAAAAVSTFQQDSKMMMQNARSAFCPRDVLNDASRNFSRRYQQHVLLESAQDYELQDQDVRAEQVDLEGQKEDGSPRARGANLLKEVQSRTLRATSWLTTRQKSYTRETGEDSGGTSPSKSGEAAPDEANGEQASEVVAEGAQAANSAAEALQRELLEAMTSNAGPMAATSIEMPLPEVAQPPPLDFNLAPAMPLSATTDSVEAGNSEAALPRVEEAASAQEPERAQEDAGTASEQA